MDNRAQKGLVLKQAREAKGISLEAVQEATKIPLDSLKAIEEGYRVRTLTDFYYRAFIKLYARYLKLDISSILGDYKPEEALPKPIVAQPRKGKDLGQSQGISFFPKDGIKKIVMVLFALAVLFTCFRLGVSWFKSRSSQPKKVEVKLKKGEVKKTDKDRKSTRLNSSHRT